jgi:predicted nuclease of restriction endonuclease-like RecB superfamily
MLTSALSIIDYSRTPPRPDRLVTKDHAHYVRYAERMLSVYRDGAGRTRRELHRAVEALFAGEAACPTKRIHAFCKLLDDAGEFETDSHGNAAELRLKVFTLAAPYHPLVQRQSVLFGNSEGEIKNKIAQELGEPWPGVEARLYADAIDFQPLKSFRGYADPTALLRHYNVAQIQACLFRAERMTIVARGAFRRILRHVKFARLMCEIRTLRPSEYRLELTGPASMLSETRRYGVQFALLIPALLACDDWELEAILQTPRGAKMRFTLSGAEGLRSHLPAPPEFDSKIEADFALAFGAKREGWTLVREAAILHRGQTTFVPDFAFRHDDGTEALFEIVGFWTPQYLEHKRETLRRFADRRILLAVPENSKNAGTAQAGNVVVYKNAIKVEPVLRALDSFRTLRE